MGNKQWTTVLKSEALNLFQNKGVNSLSSLFLSLQFKFSVQPREVCMILAFPPHHFAYLLRTPDNSNFFRSSYRKSTVLSSNFHSSRFPTLEIAVGRSRSENVLSKPLNN